LFETPLANCPRRRLKGRWSNISTGKNPQSCFEIPLEDLQRPFKSRCTVHQAAFEEEKKRIETG
jgi:hypothetical protein